MSDFDVKEKRFEQDIEEYLIAEGGYEKGDPRKFDRKLALDTETFLKFFLFFRNMICFSQFFRVDQKDFFK